MANLITNKHKKLEHAKNRRVFKNVCPPAGFGAQRATIFRQSLRVSQLAQQSTAGESALGYARFALGDLLGTLEVPVTCDLASIAQLNLFRDFGAVAVAPIAFGVAASNAAVKAVAMSSSRS